MAAIHASPQKIALVSHILPPSPSGQAIVLSRLLRDLDPTLYCLISVRDYSENTEQATRRLAGDYFTLGPESEYRLTHFARNVRSAVLAVQDHVRFFASLFAAKHVDYANAKKPTANVETSSPSWKAHIKSVALWAEDRMHLRRRVYQRAAGILRIVAKERCNAIVACSGDLIDLPASCVAARWAKLPFYAYMFDDYATNSIPHFQRQFCQEMMTRLMREATGVVVPNEFLASSYQSRFGIHPWIIPNPIDLRDPEPHKLRAMHKPPRLLYTGAVYEAHLDAMHRLIRTLQSMSANAPELHIYTSSTKQYLARHQICEPTIVHDAVSTEESIRLQQDADILFLPLAFDSPIRETINTSAPGKMGELLASGRPVLVHAPKDSFVSWYFRKHDCGEVVDQKDPAKLRQAIERLLHDVDHCRGLVSRAEERAQCDFALSIARNRFFEMLNCGSSD